MNQIDLAERFPKGSVIKGRILKVETFGVIVSFEGGEARGLIRPAEWSWAGRLADFHREAQVNQEVEAKVLGFGDPKYHHRMVDLSRRQILANPFSSYRRQHPAGAMVRGEVKFVTLYGTGVLVSLASGVDGFIPREELPAFARDLENFGLVEGDRIEAEVLGFENESKVNNFRGKVRLSITRLQARLHRERAEFASGVPLGFHPKFGPQLENFALDRRLRDISMPEVSQAILEKFRRILIVDNNEAVSESLELSLELFAFECQRAGSIEAALEIVSSQAIDLVILDLNLTREKGLELLDSLVGHNSETKVVLLTGSQADDWAFALDHKKHLAAILQKPSSLDRLLRVLGELTNGRDASGDHHLLDAGFEPSGAGIEALVRPPLGLGETFDFDRALETLRLLTKADRAVLFSYRRGPVFEVVAGTWPGLDTQSQRELDLSPVGNLIREEGQFFSLDTQSQGRRFGHLRDVRGFAGICLDYRDQAAYGLFVTSAQPNALVSETPMLLAKLALRLERALVERRLQSVLAESQGRLTTGLLASSLLHEVKNAAQALTPFSLVQTKLAKAHDGDFKGLTPQELVIFKRSILGIEQVAEDLSMLVALFRNLAVANEAETITLRDLFAELRPLLKPLADEFRVMVEEPLLDPAIPPLRLSPKLLDQALLNLILNALEQTGGIGSSLKIVSLRASYFPNAEFPVVIEVRDSGPGIHSADFERIFDPFFSTKEKGTGLGLSIARLFIERCRGRLLLADSVLYMGSTFRIELPRSVLK